MWFTCHINNGLFPFTWLFLVYQQLPLDSSYIPRDLQGFAFNNSTAFIFFPFKLDFDPGSFSSGSMKETGSVPVGTHLSPMGKSPHSTQLCPDLATQGANKAAKSPAPSKVQVMGGGQGSCTVTCTQLVR